jgi:hypothetical protein
MGETSATTTLPKNRDDVQDDLGTAPRLESKCFLPQLALVYQEAVASRDPRVTRLGLQILWRNLMEAHAE